MSVRGMEVFTLLPTLPLQARNQVSLKGVCISFEEILIITYCLPKLQGSKVSRGLLGHMVWEIVLVDVHYYQVHEYECIHFWNETQTLRVRSTYLVLVCRVVWLARLCAGLARLWLIKCE